MQITTMYTFPLIAPVMRPFCTSLQHGRDGVFGFGIKALTQLPATVFNPFSFFEIDVRKGTISRHTSSLPARSSGSMHLYADQIRNTWILTIGGSQGILEVYEVEAEPNLQWTKVFDVNNEDVGMGAKTPIAIWQQDKLYPLVFYVPDIGEVSDSRLYWTWWRSSAKEDQKTFQLIGYCDTVVPYIINEGCLLFLCQRVFNQEPPDPYLRCGPGDWHINVTAYRADGVFLHKEPALGVTFPIRNLKLPDEDLLTWLAVRMTVTEGPGYGLDRRKTCVAALALQETSTESRTGVPQTSKGGLYWMDMHGKILQRIPTPLGRQICLCLCGEKIVGTDMWEGHRRLWQWSPRAGTALRVEASLSTEVKRATLLAMEGDIAQLWCVEEYMHGIRIVRREREGLKEVEAMWCEGITLLEELPGPYLRDQVPKGMAVYQNTLFLLGIDPEKRLKLFQIE
jgi:hypothetical protein